VPSGFSMWDLPHRRTAQPGAVGMRPQGGPALYFRSSFTVSMSTGPNQPGLGRFPIGWLIVSLELDRVNLGAVRQHQTDQREAFLTFETGQQNQRALSPAGLAFDPLRTL